MKTSQTTMKTSRTRILMTVGRGCLLLGALVATIAHAAESPDPLPPGDSASADASAPDPASASAGQTSASPTPAHPSDWQVNTTSYVWLAGGHGSLNAFGNSVGWKASPNDLLSHADFGIMNLVGVRYKRLVILNDFYWAPFTLNKTRTTSLLPNLLANAVLSSQLKYTQIMLAPEVGFRLLDHPKFKFDALTGYRYWYNGVTANLATSNTINNTTTLRSVHLHGFDNWADPVVGGRMQIPFSEKMMATIWGDVGGWGAGANMDYQITSAITYQIKPKFAASVAWRYMFYDHGTIIHSINAYSGIAIGLTHTWCCAE